MRTLLLLILAAAPFIMQAQFWSPAGATWHYHRSQVFSPGYVKIYYDGDTMINGTQSQILRKFSGWYNYGMMQYDSAGLATEYTSWLDSVVFVWHENNWDTLYDFGAQAGDSWFMAKNPFVPVCDSNSIITVTDTGTIQVSSQNLRYLVVDMGFGNGANHTDTIVEKIGFLQTYMFPFDYCDGMTDANEGGPFRCYSDNTLLQVGRFNPCDFILDIQSFQDDNQPELFPNPIQDILNIDLPWHGKSEFIVLDITGRMVKKHILTAGTHPLDLKDLGKGVYMYQLNGTDGRKASGRLVKH